MFCKNCGTKLDDNAKFCGNCGWKQGSEIEKNKNSNVNFPKIPIVPIIVIVAVIFLAAVIKLIFFNSRSVEMQNKNIKIVSEYSSDTLVDEMDTVTFGSYPQSDISGNSKEPIEWIVLEKNNNEMILLSKYILDCKCYNDAVKEATWENCTLRKWLNDTFYNIAFSDDEKKNIIESNVANKINSEYGTLGGNDTNDNIYLLSIEECRKYFGSDMNNINIVTKGTEYAKNVDNYSDKLYVSDNTEWYDGNSSFWLRSSGENQSWASYISEFGQIVTFGIVVATKNIGIRPVLKVKNISGSSFDIQIENEKTSNEYSSKILIDENVKTVSEYDTDTLVDEMDTVTFGSYPQSDSIKDEPIEWLVLEKNKDEMLLLSKYVLDIKKYNAEQKDVTWENCTLRSWLNDTFYYTAFNDEERKSIIKSTVVNKDNDEYGTFGGNDTSDYIYILSIDECWKYFGNLAPYVNNRLATKNTKITDLRELLPDLTESITTFWLRSPGKNQNTASYVLDGWIIADGESVDNIIECIRPVIRVKYASDSNSNNGWNGDYYYKDGEKLINSWVGDYYIGEDGKYVKNTWAKYENDWYYCGNDGKVIKNDWVDNQNYYVDGSGKMLKNTTTPDGYYVGSDGKYINEIVSNKNEVKVSKFIYDKYNELKVYWHMMGEMKIDSDGNLWANANYPGSENITIYYSNGANVGYGHDYSHDRYWEDDFDIYSKNYQEKSNAEIYREKSSAEEYEAIYKQFNNIVDCSPYITLESSDNYNVNEYRSDIPVDENEKFVDEYSSETLVDENVKTVGEYSRETLVDEMDTVTFGSYPQSDISGKTKEPIEWLVLEKNDNEMLLLSKYILDCKCYNDEYKDVTWETCTLRHWLNNTFYNTAFSDDEKKSIIKSNVVNKDNSEYGTSGGNDTNDYVYSLSIDECRKYFGNEDGTGLNKRLATKGTEYGKNVDNHGSKLWVIDDTEWYDGNSDFWLRSPGRDQASVAAVYDVGHVDDYGIGVDNNGRGLRPLIRVKYK